MAPKSLRMGGAGKAHGEAGNSRKVLIIIVLSQFCCTSLWFAGNGIMGDLIAHFSLHPTALGHLTAAVQLGFISGTLLFALFSVPDRFSPSRVFFFCALCGALVNLGILASGNTLSTLLIYRFLTGLFLAGIYPVGMKIAADYFEMGLGRSLGYLVGALVLGTSFPHFLKNFTQGIHWSPVIWVTSGLALTGGVLVLTLVPDGPYRKTSRVADISSLLKVFKNPGFRAPAFGYFGHMWELYGFWTFIPIMVETYISGNPGSDMSVPLLAFILIGIGGPACVLTGHLSEFAGKTRTAAIALAISGACCLLSPWILIYASPAVFISFLIVWGITVIGDSPLFSALVAGNTRPENRGTALTIVNCIGFSITIVSIQMLNFLRDVINPYYLYVILAPGPALGLWALLRGGKRPGI